METTLNSILDWWQAVLQKHVDASNCNLLGCSVAEQVNSSTCYEEEREAHFMHRSIAFLQRFTERSRGRTLRSARVSGLG